MTNGVARAYAATGAVLVFFLAWAGIAARPAAEPSASVGEPQASAIDRQLERVEGKANTLRRLLRRADSAPEPAALPVVRISAAPPATRTASS